MEILSSISSETFALYALIVANVILTVTVILLYIKVKNLLKGKDAKTLEDTIIGMESRLKDMAWFRSEMEKYLESVELRLKKSIQGVETIRFNPFKGTGDGGNQSFATTLINEKGDGVIFSSLYSRDRVSVFAKPVKNGGSEYGLTEEEKSSLATAKKTATETKTAK
jgi:hypothetical protein